MHNPYFVAITSILLTKLGFPFLITVVVSVIIGMVASIIIDRLLIQRFKTLKFLLLGKPMK